MMFRIGFGYDVHRLVEGRNLTLGGVVVPWHKGGLGHSDADGLVHALCDALLGALSLGDIGKLFPDTDPKYKNINSLILLKEVMGIVREKGFLLSNADTTVAMQKPRLAPYILEMRKKISETLEVDVSQVSVKATTTEEMGFEGAGDGFSAYAVVLLTKA